MSGKMHMAQAWLSKGNRTPRCLGAACVSTNSRALPAARELIKFLTGPRAVGGDEIAGHATLLANPPSAVSTVRMATATPCPHSFQLVFLAVIAASRDIKKLRTRAAFACRLREQFRSSAAAVPLTDRQTGPLLWRLLPKLSSPTYEA